MLQRDRISNITRRSDFWPVSSHHRTEHPLASGEHQTHSHHGEEEEDQAQEGGEEAAATAPLFVLFHAFAEQLGAGDVEGEVGFWAAAGLKKSVY